MKKIKNVSLFEYIIGKISFSIAFRMNVTCVHSARCAIELIQSVGTQQVNEIQHRDEQ